MSSSNRFTRPALLAALVISPVLTACSVNMNQNSIMENVVRSAPLANGKSVSLGYKVPDPAAQCQLINETARNWAMAQTTGSLKLGGGRQLLEEEAVDSINQRPEANINYVEFLLPNEAYVGAVNIAPGDQAKTTYFSCVTPPQPH